MCVPSFYHDIVRIYYSVFDFITFKAVFLSLFFSLPHLLGVNFFLQLRQIHPALHLFIQKALRFFFFLRKLR